MLQALLKDGASIQVCMSAEDLKVFGLELLHEFAMKEEQRKKAEKESEIYLSTHQVCEMLGVDRSTLYRWKKDGYLMPCGIGGKIRYAKSSITKIMEERR